MEMTSFEFATDCYKWQTRIYQERLDINHTIWHYHRLLEQTRTQNLQNVKSNWPGYDWCCYEILLRNTEETPDTDIRHVTGNKSALCALGSSSADSHCQWKTLLFHNLTERKSNLMILQIYGSLLLYKETGSSFHYTYRALDKHRRSRIHVIPL
jgi:hypothetical protein